MNGNSKLGYDSMTPPGYQYPSQLQTDVVKQTAIGHATETLSRVREIAQRLEGLSESICGVDPMESSGKGAPTPQPSGILPALQYASEEATDYISRANRALDRINSFI